jgi:hypothetical protein
VGHAGCGARDNNYIMTPRLKVLRKLFRMGLAASRVGSETKNANGDFELSLSHFVKASSETW